LHVIGRLLKSVQWRLGKKAGDGHLPELHFGEIFLSKNLYSKMQNFGLKTPILRNLAVKLKF